MAGDVSSRGLTRVSLQEILNESVKILSSSQELVEKQLVRPESETLVLAAYSKVLGRKISRSDLFFSLSEVVPFEVAEWVVQWSLQRASGKILQHLTGVQSFLEHEYEVSPSVLVPRPETEVLVRSILEFYESQGGSPTLGFEVGLGSGVISIELLAKLPSLRMMATELSSAAAEVARRNATKILGQGSDSSARLSILRVDRSELVLEPWIDAGLKADFIVSNPPYLDESMDEVTDEVRNQEPKLALFAPAGDPLFFYRRLSEQGLQVLKPGGWIWVELAHERAHEVKKEFELRGWKAELIVDLVGRERILRAGMN